jgi:formate hydrogenlyase transcriptional activator
MDESASGLSTQEQIQQYRALLEVSEAIASHRDLNDLFKDLAHRLKEVVPFQYLNLILHDPAREVMRLHVLYADGPVFVQPGFESPLEETPAGRVWQTQSPLLISNLEEVTDYPRIFQMLKAHAIKSACLLPLTSAQRRLGALGFGSREGYFYKETDIGFMQQVARQVAVAVDNVLNYQDLKAVEQNLSRERDRLRLLLEVTNAVVVTLDIHELLSAISGCLRRVFHHDYASLAIYEPENQQMRLHALDFPDSKGLLKERMSVPFNSAPANEAFLTGKPVLLMASDSTRFPSELAERHVAEGLKSGCCLPLVSHNRALGTLNIGSRREEAFSSEDIDLLGQVASQVAMALENVLAYRQIQELKDKLAEEKLYLEDEIRTEFNFEELVGESAVLKRVLQDAETVGATASTVLIHGETGTGKELIARAIHNLSPRRGRTFVKINCAAIPTGLLESELFGHEKGAFTGAISRKIGRFELSHQGTIFLDEVGDIPLELQPKLLRVLQEQEFERLGGTRTIRVNVRLLAATNRDLAEMVEQGSFRRDLYYRLNVFPLHVPPLRERVEDVPTLVRYFAQKFAYRMDKAIESIPTEAMEALSQWHWPGNVRELENFIERAVILTRGTVLQLPMAELAVSGEGSSSQRPRVTKPPSLNPGGHEARTLSSVERQYILKALDESNWVVGGPRGAAARLGLKRTTLQSRMRKLGITRM